MASSVDVCSFFFEPVLDADAPPKPESEPAPTPDDPSQPKKRGRTKRVSLGGANRHRCRLCLNVYTQAVSTGYTNLLTHLRIKHPDWEDMFGTQKLEPASVTTSPPTNSITTSTLTTSPPATLSATSTSGVPKGKQGAGRKRGPVYQHYEDVPSSPGKTHKKMRCLYCREDSPQISGRLKLHLSTKCPEAPENVKAQYAGAARLISNRKAGNAIKAEGAVKVDNMTKADGPVKVDNVSKDDGAVKVDNVSKEVEGAKAAPTVAKSTPVATPEKATIKPLHVKQQSPALRMPTQAPTPKQATTREAGNLHSFEDKLTTALVATNAPWSLLDNAAFREAMEILRPASGDLALTAVRARTEVLDRLAQKYDQECRAALATSNAITLVINNTGVGDSGAKKTTFVALDEWRHAFVLAEGNGAAASPCVTEVLSVLSSLPCSSSSSKVFMCTSTSGAYARARQELLRTASSPTYPFTLTGVCMTQQTALLLRELIVSSLSLEEALDNAVLTADALHVMSSLRERVFREIFSESDNGGVEGDANAFAQVSVTSWRSIAMAVKQATRLKRFLRSAISQEKQDSSTTSPILRQLVDIRSSDMAWNALRHTAQLLAPLNFLSALSELQTTTSGQMLALWIWLLGAATRSPLLDGNSDTLIARFMQRMECYVEDHFFACLVLDPRVHGAGLSVSGLRRARGVTVRVATSLIPNFNENNFIRSYNDYMKQTGDFGEPGVWNAANTANPMEFWGDYEGDPLHSQLAVVAKTVCSYVPHTSSIEELWAAHARRSSNSSTEAVSAEASKLHEKCTKIRHSVSVTGRADVKSVVTRFQTLLEGENEPSEEEMLQYNAAAQETIEQEGSAINLSVRTVLQSIQDGLKEDVAETTASATNLDASWFDISSTGLDKIRGTMEKFLSAAIQQ
ncbi:hypothetical protein PR001_g14181 [Phytophthora rubi]|uniref:BED-type domain-containing protein n=1 Tax=Phytophthora rubi TaxID=129364 RepID=A0A6A3LFT9_9STRA|nr:hypothetical protein PR001_g14181 [Phytophthora rubi]